MAQYNADAIQAAIDSDPAISPAEGKAIHALLKGPCGRTDRLIYFVRGRTAYHYNCPACEIVLLRTRPGAKPEPEVAACTCGWMDYAEVDFDGPEDAHGAGCDINLQRDYARGLLRHPCRCPAGFGHTGACVMARRAASLPPLPGPEVDDGPHPVTRPGAEERRCRDCWGAPECVCP